MKIPTKLPQFQASPALFIVSGDFETHFYLASGGTIAQRGYVAFSCSKQHEEKLPVKDRLDSRIFPLKHSHDDSQEFYGQTVAQLRELLGEFPVQKIYLFAPHRDAFGLFNLFSIQEKGLLEDIVFGEFIRMHPFGLAQTLSEPISS